ncbi:MAG: phospholipase [Alphaproteobacteria bacterium]|nr:phospholipase [Alphaproteobacteria bacterium]
MTNATLNGPTLPPFAGGKPKALVVLLHGLGADGADLIGLGHAWAQALPGAAFVAPNAPYPCDFAPSGRQWFSLQSFDEDTILTALEAVAPRLDQFVDTALANCRLTGQDLALVGFSQGAMLALHAGLRRNPSPAAIVAYSGFLVGAEGLSAHLAGKPPVLLVHGDRDEVVQPHFMPAAEAVLNAAGVPVQALLRPELGHGIDEAGMHAGLARLIRSLPNAAVE